MRKRVDKFLFPGTLVNSFLRAVEFLTILREFLYLCFPLSCFFLAFCFLLIGRPCILRQLFVFWRFVHLCESHIFIIAVFTCSAVTPVCMTASTNCSADVSTLISGLLYSFFSVTPLLTVALSAACSIMPEISFSVFPAFLKFSITFFTMLIIPILSRSSFPFTQKGVVRQHRPECS